MDETTKSKAQAHEEAIEWLSVLRSGDVSRQTREQFEDWLHGDRQNKLAFREVEQVYRDLDFVAIEADLHPSVAMAVANVLPLNRWHRHRPSKFGKSVISGLLPVAAALAMLVFFQPFGTQPELRKSGAQEGLVAPILVTNVQEIRNVNLEDGSTVTLGPKSRIETEFNRDRRFVRLLEGEAFFEVTKDPGRPFFVASQDVVVRVVGTKFDVKRSAEIVHVAVLEGVVEVAKSEGLEQVETVFSDENTDKQVLTAGERVSAARRVELPPNRPLGQLEAGAWRKGRLAYEDTSLAEVVADLARYYPHEITITTPKIGDLRSTLAFNTSDVEQILGVIEAIHPVEVRQTETGNIEIVSLNAE